MTWDLLSSLRPVSAREICCEFYKHRVHWPYFRFYSCVALYSAASLVHWPHMQYLIESDSTRFDSLKCNDKINFVQFESLPKFSWLIQSVCLQALKIAHREDCERLREASHRLVIDSEEEENQLRRATEAVLQQINETESEQRVSIKSSGLYKVCLIVAKYCHSHSGEVSNYPRSIAMSEILSLHLLPITREQDKLLEVIQVIILYCLASFLQLSLSQKAKCAWFDVSAIRLSVPLLFVLVGFKLSLIRQAGHWGTWERRS